MTRAPSTTDICAFCDEFRKAAPEYADLGLGRCRVHEGQPPLSVHVRWDARTCISYRLDKPNLSARREFVDKQRAKQEAG